LRDLRQTWRAFDSDGQLKRWRTYLASDQSKPRRKGPARATSAEASASPKAAAPIAS
jgi:hypothetical protein